MRRLGRILLNVATGVSLWICLAITARWAGDNEVGRRWVSAGTPTPPGSKVVAISPMRGRSKTQIEFPLHDRRYVDIYFGRVPLAVAVGLTAALPAWAACAYAYRAARRSRAWRLAIAGLYPVCGYDCRATPGRCPECGAVVAQEARSG